MKTKEQIQGEMKYGRVFTAKEFLSLVNDGLFNSYDGSGYFHNGEEEMNFNVWENPGGYKRYPFVCWYNK